MSSIRAGKSSSRICVPRGTSRWAWRPWGTPRRFCVVSNSGSRSATVTRSYTSASTRAARSPAMPAPRTTAWSPIFGIFDLPRHDACCDARTAGDVAASGKPPKRRAAAVWVVPGSESADPVLERVRRRGCARADAQLGQNVADVPLDGPLAEEQLGGDALVGLADRDQLGKPSPGTVSRRRRPG